MHGKRTEIVCNLFGIDETICLATQNINHNLNKQKTETKGKPNVHVDCCKMKKQ